MFVAGQHSDVRQGWEWVAAPGCTTPMGCLGSPQWGLSGFSAAPAKLTGWGNPLSTLTLPPLAIASLNLPLLCLLPSPFH